MLMTKNEKKLLEARKAETVAKTERLESQIEAMAPGASPHGSLLPMPDGPWLSPTLEFGSDELVELAAPVVLEQLQRIRERRESGELTLTPAVVAQLGQLRLAGQQLLGIAGWR